MSDKNIRLETTTKFNMHQRKITKEMEKIGKIKRKNGFRNIMKRDLGNLKKNNSQKMLIDQHKNMWSWFYE